MGHTGVSLVSCQFSPSVFLGFHDPIRATQVLEFVEQAPSPALVCVSLKGLPLLFSGGQPRPHLVLVKSFLQLRIQTGSFEISLVHLRFYWLAPGLF